MFSQTLWFSAAQVAGRMIGLALLIYAGNVLGVDIFGAFANIQVLVMIMLIASTFGMDLWLSRHVANHALSNTDLNWVIAWKWLLTIAVGVLVALGLSQAWFGDVLLKHRASLLILSLSLLFDHIALSANAVLEGNRKLARCASLSLVRWVTVGVLGWSLLAFRPSLELLCLAFLLASAARALTAWLWVKPHLSQSRPTPHMFPKIVRFAWPMALMNFMVVIYFQVDILMLPELADSQATGIYKAAYTMVEAWLFFSAGIAAALYPFFSARDISMERKLEQLELGIRILLVVALPIAIGTHIISQPLIDLLYALRPDEFGASASALNWLAWALPGMFLNATLVRLFLGIHQQFRVLANVAATAVLNVVLNVLWIPTYGTFGAAGATILSESVLLLLFLFQLRRQFPSFNPIRPVLAPAATSLVVIPLGYAGGRINPWFAVLLAALGYLLLIWAFRVMTPNQLRRFGH